MRSRGLVVLVVCALYLAPAAARADPPEQGWFVPQHSVAPPVTVDTRPTSKEGQQDIDIFVRHQPRPLLPETRVVPEQRNPLDDDHPGATALDDKLSSTRSGSRDGCHAGSVCYGNAPRLRDTLLGQ